MCVSNTNIQNDLRMLCLINRNIKDECIDLETMSSTTLGCMSLRGKCASKIAKKINPRHRAQWS